MSMRAYSPAYRGDASLPAGAGARSDVACLGARHEIASESDPVLFNVDAKGLQLLPVVFGRGLSYFVRSCGRRTCVLPSFGGNSAHSAPLRFGCGAVQLHSGRHALWLA
mgnify:CR=1 FL=1